MTERGAGLPHIGGRMERREAQRPTSLAARIPITVSLLATGDTAVDALGGPQGPPGRPRQPADRGRRSALAPSQVGFTRLAHLKSRSRVNPRSDALHPLMGRRKKGKTLSRASLINRQAERWLRGLLTALQNDIPLAA